jgi:hypothetical protein
MSRGIATVAAVRQAAKTSYVKLKFTIQEVCYETLRRTLVKLRSSYEII